MYDTTKTVREFAVEIPQATRLFETLGIDYCCGGGKSLRDACATANVSVDEVVSKLLATVKSTEPNNANWTSSELGDLVDHIVATHHVYVRQELPRLEQLLNKVVSKHSENHPELTKVQKIFRELSAELTSHLMKEEQILFPYVKELESTRKAVKGTRAACFGSVRNPIHMMEIEHDSAGDALRELRSLTNGFVAPEEGCFTYQTVYRGLAEFEADLHQHIHLENNILFPRAIELEKSAQQ
jgi:regulator of cell morphogenesis and NO signaling